MRTRGGVAEDISLKKCDAPRTSKAGKGTEKSTSTASAGQRATEVNSSGCQNGTHKRSERWREGLAETTQTQSKAPGSSKDTWVGMLRTQRFCRCVLLHRDLPITALIEILDHFLRWLGPWACAVLSQRVAQNVNSCCAKVSGYFLCSAWS